MPCSGAASSDKTVPYLDCKETNKIKAAREILSPLLFIVVLV
jgi:hypothetical protein